MRLYNVAVATTYESGTPYGDAVYAIYAHDAGEAMQFAVYQAVHDALLYIRNPQVTIVATRTGTLYGLGECKAELVNHWRHYVRHAFYAEQVH